MHIHIARTLIACNHAIMLGILFGIMFTLQAYIDCNNASAFRRGNADLTPVWNVNCVPAIPLIGRGLLAFHSHHISTLQAHLHAHCVSLERSAAPQVYPWRLAYRGRVRVRQLQISTPSPIPLPHAPSARLDPTMAQQASADGPGLYLVWPAPCLRMTLACALSR